MVSCCMESFICLWYHVLEMVVVMLTGTIRIIGVNGWMLRLCGPFQAGKWMVTACVAIVVTVLGFFIFASEFHYIINGKRNHNN